MRIKQLCDRKVRDFAVALRARKVSGAFEKRAPDHVVATGINHDVIVRRHHLLRNYGCRK